ncbi:MAG TPA: ABC transporter permease [Vicinamibacterales bacterium]|nr:ABC transporter permease [Vicinamibacterales bacterium]
MRRTLRRTWNRLLGSILHRNADGDFGDELDSHIQLLTEEYLRRGLSPEEAHRRARVQFGSVEAAKERYRDQRGLPWLDDLERDLRHALRSLRRTPGFTAVALLTLALGIGANAAIFGIVDGVLLRPLPYSDADRLVRLYQANAEQGLRNAASSLLDFEDWHVQARTLGPMSAYQYGPVIVTGLGDPLEIESAFIAGDFFGTFGVPAAIGRSLLEEDIRQARPNAVISERLWRTYFATDPRVLGRAIVFYGRSYTVVGVMPSRFRYPTPETDVWTPRSVLSELEIGRNVRNQRFLDVVARLADGASVEVAQAELNAVASRLALQYPATNAGWTGITVVPLQMAIVGDVDRTLVLVFALAGAILLIVCANLANMLLARGTARSHEMAIRTALGASRMRIVRQGLTEALLLGLVGGALGIVLSVLTVQLVLELSAGTLPRVEDVRVDGRVAGFGFLLALATALAFGLVPALSGAQAKPHDNLKDGRRVAARVPQVQRVLVVAQVGLAVVLVVSAGLMARSFLALRGADPGFEPKNALAVTMQINLTGVDRPGPHIIQRREEWIERISALPGVVSVGTITSLPLRDKCKDYIEFTRADGTGGPDGGPLRADNCLVSSDYLATMRIPLLRGKPLPDRLTEGAPRPFLISETAARRFWPGQDALGQVVRLVTGRRGQAIVIGVVGDVRQVGLRQDPPSAVYFPQAIGPRAVTTLVARTAGDPLMLAGPIREAVRRLDPNQAIRSITALNGVISESIARDRFFTILFGSFGALALVLATMGVYGVLAYSVAERTQEIGVRMALGADQRQVIGMVIGQGGRLVAIGLTVGLLGSLILMPFLASLLYQTNQYDLLTFVTVPVVLATGALIACALPAWRAASVEPITALRAE